MTTSFTVVLHKSFGVQLSIISGLEGTKSQIQGHLPPEEALEETGALLIDHLHCG
jgi:hypothetical protein